MKAEKLNKIFNYLSLPPRAQLFFLLFLVTLLLLALVNFKVFNVPHYSCLLDRKVFDFVMNGFNDF
jgi:energy-converting hydrogenase Eha subunit F